MHATLPYLTSGAGIALEDGATLGYCFGKIEGRSVAAKNLALQVYEESRRHKTESIVARGNLQQELYHFVDGDEQRARDDRLRKFGSLEERITTDEFEPSNLP